ncbi:MAG: hypothetical protein MGG11_04920 [Trichodesmium sp. MAG_R03]|nr:hypothetical protein [Trichodesmium sp. MAG_R03]
MTIDKVPKFLKAVRERQAPLVYQYQSTMFDEHLAKKLDFKCFNRNQR